MSLIAFLISVILAYMGAQELRKFGADIFVVDLVTVGVLRELGVLLTAIIVAGRSGSAFAAEIGAMQLNEEVDALYAIGVDPIEVLVLPRLLGLVIALPLLTLVADIIGLVGGGLLCHSLLHMPLAQYLHRAQGAIASTTFWVGMIKAPVFACLIAICRLLQRPVRARLVTRTGPADHARGGAVDLLRDPGRCAVRGTVHGARHLMRTLLEVQGVVNRFGAQVVHQGVDMQVYEGEVFGIIGGSGAGKSVLLRTILGLRRPNAGSVRFLGRELAQHERRRAACAEGQLWRDLSARRAVQLARRAAERADADARASAAARRGRSMSWPGQGAAGRTAGGRRAASIQHSCPVA